MNRTSWIIIGTTLLVCAGLGLFAIKPLISRSFDIYQQTQTAKTDLSDASQKKDVLNTLSKNNQLDNLYSIASKYIPEDQSSGELIVDITNMANQSNLKIGQFSLDNSASPSTSSPTTATSLNELKFSLSISGGFPNLVSFLKNTENSSRLITFKSVSLSQASGSLTAQISGSAYWKKGGLQSSSLSNIQISKTTIDKFLNLTTPSTQTTIPAATGFSRVDPFTAL